MRETSELPGPWKIQRGTSGGQDQAPAETV